MDLIIPDYNFYESYKEAIKEYKEHNIDTYNFFFTSGNNIYEQFEESRLGKNLPDNYVAGTYLWLVNDDRFLGEICIRHRLTEDLLRFGGNISYGVRYSEWRKGLGTVMLSKGLKYSKEVLGLKKVLITCNESNIASARIIEKNGGKLQDTIVSVIDDVERKFFSCIP